MPDRYVMLTKKDCDWCDKAKALIAEKDPETPVMEFVIEQPSQLRDYMIAMGMTTVPQIWWVEEDYAPLVIGGYNELVQTYEDVEEVYETSD
jgi:glutaredoxin